MELSKKTTILLSPDLHSFLTRLAEEQNVSLGALIRTACEQQYGYVPDQERVRAAEELSRLALPVAEPETLKRESTVEPDSLLP